MKLYKFIGRYLPTVLESLEIKVSRPSQLNDPFDFSPSFDCLRSEADLIKRFSGEETLLRYYVAMKNDGEFTGSLDEFRTFWEVSGAKSRAIELAHSQQDLQVLQEEMQRFFYQWNDENYCVLSLSAKKDDLLMWAHYTEGHTGGVIAFDTEQPPFSTSSDLHAVIYSVDRPVVDYFIQPSDPEFSDQMLRAAITKAPSWKYEQEYRFLLPLNKLIQKRTEKGIELAFLSLDPKSIVSVTLGSRCPENTRARVATQTKRPEMNHIVLRQAVLDDKSFVIHT